MTEKKPLKPKQALRRMAQRNLKIALELRSKFGQLKKNLGFSSDMSSKEYITWKDLKAEEIRDGILQLVKDLNLPMDQLPFINWLFEATDEEIEELISYVNNPEGIPPKSYHLIYTPGYESISIGGPGWSEEIGYRVAVITREKEHWRIWGDLRDVPEEAWWPFLQHPGDFVIKGNLEVFDVASWRRIGGVLSGLKSQKHLGKKLGLGAGGKKGKGKAKKIILGDWTWEDIQDIVLHDPTKYTELRKAYVDAKCEEFTKGYIKEHSSPPSPELIKKDIQKNAIKSYSAHVKQK